MELIAENIFFFLSFFNEIKKDIEVFRKGESCHFFYIA